MLTQSQSQQAVTYGKAVRERCDALLAIAAARDDLAFCYEKNKFQIPYAQASVERALARHARASVAETLAMSTIRACNTAEIALDILDYAEQYIDQSPDGRAAMDEAASTPEPEQPLETMLP